MGRRLDRRLKSTYSSSESLAHPTKIIPNRGNKKYSILKVRSKKVLPILSKSKDQITPTSWKKCTYRLKIVSNTQKNIKIWISGTL